MAEVIVLALETGFEEVALHLLKSRAGTTFELHLPASPLVLGLHSRRERFTWAVLRDPDLLHYSIGCSGHDTCQNFVQECGGNGLVKLAIHWLDLPILHALLQAGVEVTGEDVTEAIKSGSRELVQLLVEFGGDIEYSPSMEWDSWETLRDLTDLGEMVNYMSGDDLKELYSRNRDLAIDLLGRFKSKSGIGRFGTPLLHAAIIAKDAPMVKDLMNNGVYTGFYNDETKTALALAILHADDDEATEILLPLIRKTRSINQIVSWDGPTHSDREQFYQGMAIYSMETPLLVAIETGRESVVRLLLEQEADINGLAIGTTITPVQKAAALGFFALTKLLISLGADVNAKPLGPFGATAVQLAAMSGYAGIVSLLIEEHADVTAPASREGRTAIEGAAENGRVDTVQLLLNTGRFDSEPGAGQAKSAMVLAEKRGHEAVVDLLRSHVSELPTTPPSESDSPRPTHCSRFSEEDRWNLRKNVWRVSSSDEIAYSMDRLW
jgi:ankyrin repeat protein